MSSRRGSASTETIERLLLEMTVPEMIGQMTQVSNECISPGEVADHFIGSVLSGGNGNPSPNTPQVWFDMVSGFSQAARETRLEVPLVYGVDAVHGHGNVGGATVFPHNIGLGAAGDVDLVERIGRATARELRATGVRWAFAPTVAVPRDVRWGRTYEGYGSDPHLVASLGAAAIRGLHGGDAEHLDVLACAKHYVGDGGTMWGTAPRFDFVDWWDGWGEGWQIDQGDTRISESDLRSIHLTPYVAAIEAGVMTVMASYSSWNGVKLHAHPHLLTDVLKGELGFGGFVVSDWMGVDQIGPDYGESVVTAINAGIDMVMVPEDYHRFIRAMTAAVTDGRISRARLEDAVRRILRAKAAAGLFETATEAPPLSTVGSIEHRELADEAVGRSAVLLKDTTTLPLSPAIGSLAVAGPAAHDIGLQCGGWTVGWQGGTGRTTDGTTLLDGLRATIDDVAYDPTGEFPGRAPGGIGVVALAESPYAEGPGDSAIPRLSEKEHAVFARIRAITDTLILVIYSGRPVMATDLIARADAAVAAWLPGSEASALADLLFGRRPFTGRTPQPWPRTNAGFGDPTAQLLFDAGHGLGAAAGPAPASSGAVR